MNITKMTPEFAERILNRKAKRKPEMAESRVIAILTDWLEQMTYSEIVAKHRVSMFSVRNIVTTAREQARAVLESKP